MLLKLLSYPSTWIGALALTLVYVRWWNDRVELKRQLLRKHREEVEAIATCIKRWSKWWRGAYLAGRGQCPTTFTRRLERVGIPVRLEVPATGKLQVVADFSLGHVDGNPITMQWEFLVDSSNNIGRANAVFRGTDDREVMMRLEREYVLGLYGDSGVYCRKCKAQMEAQVTEDATIFAG
jgi:hypothetical protein